ncbi:hypothetical protein JUJ52_10455 [Virgibacillus sp. AGTR]|uniref:hypothetical protein n=1 Tax=Virgibacillus TaxID=84406 RepID=UPI0003FE23E2|nr:MULTISPECIES: hypothetical protein [Bacillaceae]MCC2250386.1 hypothetical protein [Virgibacillus sp. AGTR]MDY7044017.1 hypothetical protein [Virgibacillus sp. M23]QRZ17618.1 hypothetical protein JUJ52_17925 [Virgibacillus sp. AGTR]WBX78986.1 hypothetical protein PD280_14370 [Virgibacillus salarius]
MNRKQELVDFLSDSLPVLSDYINQIVLLIPRGVENLEIDHIKKIVPKLLQLISHIKEGYL